MPVTEIEVVEGVIGATMQVLLFWYLYRRLQARVPAVLPAAIVVFWFSMWLVRKAGVRLYRTIRSGQTNNQKKPDLSR